VKNYPLMKKINTILLYTVLLIAILLSLAPILYLFITSFKPAELTFSLPPVWIFTPTLKNYVDVINGGEFGRYFINSLVVALTATFISLVLGAFAAYGFARFKFRGKFWLRMSVLIPQMLPPITIIVPLYVLFNGFKLIDTQIALVISYLTFTIPLAVWLLIGFFEDVPIDLEESAMIDGCSRLGALFRIVLPIVTPGLAATAILGFLYCWNEFFYAVILTGRDARTLPVTITSFMTNKAILWGRITAAGSLVLVPVLIFSLIAQRYLIRGLSKGAVKG
jgi:multiple sugar transport system permease protein